MGLPQGRSVSVEKFPTLGRAVCREHLRAAEEKAVEDQERAKKRFREWVRTKVPDAEYMNICSGPQVRPPATSYTLTPCASCSLCSHLPFMFQVVGCE